MTFSPMDCDRARESFSAELDGELPELERQRLSMHLIACPACTAWTVEVRDATRCLRETTLEAPAVSVPLHRRARRWTIGPAAAVSSAAALVASLVVAIGPQNATFGSSPRTGVSQLAPRANPTRLTLPERLIAIESRRASAYQPIAQHVRFRAA